MRGLHPACLLLLLAPCAALAALEQHLYREQTGAQSTLFEWTAERQSDQVRIVASEPGSQFQTQCSADGATLHWQVNDTHRDIQARREGDHIVLHGMREGQPYSEEISLDAAPWYQALSYSLRIWLAEGSASKEFWTLRPDNLAAVKLRAQRLGTETLDMMHGGQGQAVHVEVRAVGLRAAFWKADYWFRATDHLFILYHAVNGLPGTSATLIELMPEAGTAQVPVKPTGL